MLYRLPELIAANPGATVFVVEGEKDVHRFGQLGLEATCNPGGAGKWRDEYSDSLIDREVVIMPDNDPQATNPDGTPKFHADGRPVLPGQDHAQDVAASSHGKASKVRVLELPGLKPKGDVSDWLDAGNDVSQLCQMVEDAPEWTPDEATNGRCSRPRRMGSAGAVLCFQSARFPVRSSAIMDTVI